MLGMDDAIGCMQFTNKHSRSILKTIKNLLLGTILCKTIFMWDKYNDHRVWMRIIQTVLCFSIVAESYDKSLNGHKYANNTNSTMNIDSYILLATIDTSALIILRPPDCNVATAKT